MSLIIFTLFKFIKLVGLKGVAMEKVKVFSWNLEKGFGFARLANGQQAFIHVNSVRPRQPRGIDLRGMELVVLRVEEGERGFRIIEATMLPVEHRWREVVGRIYHEVKYAAEEGFEEVESFGLVHIPSGAKPEFNEVQAEAARTAGCPDGLITQAKQFFDEKTAELLEGQARQASKQAAVEAARVLIRTLPKEVGVVIYQLTMPMPTQTVDRPCVDIFNTNWGSFVSRQVPVGSNAHYAWAEVSLSDIEGLSVIGVYKCSKMEYKFAPVWWKGISFAVPFRVFQGGLECGERVGAHHSPFDSDWKGL